MPRAWSRAPASTVTPRAPSWRAVSKPIPLLAPVTRAIVVSTPPTLGPARAPRQRPDMPGTGDTTLSPAAIGDQERHWRNDHDQPRPDQPRPDQPRPDQPRP